MNDFPDFEDLRTLASNNPEEFDRICRAEINRVIDSAPEDIQQRLKGMQFIIDTKLNMTNGAVQRYNLMVEMFWEGFLKFKDAVNGTYEKLEPGRVIKFGRRDEQKHTDRKNEKDG